MFNDDDHSGTNASVSTGETITFASTAAANGVVIKSDLDYVSYSADGQARFMDGTGGFQADTLRACNTSASLSNDNRARDLVLSRAGRIIIQRPTGIDASCPAP